MRTLVYTKVRDLWLALPDTPMGDPVRLYQMNAAGVGDIPAQPEKPFALLREGVTSAYPEVSETSDAERIPFDLYCYDEAGSLVLLSSLLRKVAPVIKSLRGQASPTGARCLGASWGGLSQDFFDPTYEASVRFASFVLTATHHEEA